jgi:class 3 adenylate cyclase
LRDDERVFKAYLDDKRQSLQAPLASVVAYVSSMLELPVFAADAALRRDGQRIDQAAAEMLLALELVSDLTPKSQTEISRLRHDMRNSIGLVDGYSEMLLEDCSDGEAVELLHQVRRQSRLFQERLEKFTLSSEMSEASDSISAIFQSFKSGVLSNNREHLTGCILVVDDNDSSRDLLAHQLQRQDHMVIEAASGQRCLEVMRSSQPDLVLLDLVMPDMNGYEVLQVIRDDDVLRRIPVIVVSGMQDEEGAVRCIDAGASDYLLKPVNGTLLRARIGALLETKRWQDREREYLAELEKSQRFIRKVFGRYLSDEVVQRLLDDDNGLSLGGERRIVTILMADIRGFSAISQQLAPEQCVQLLNNYLGVMTEVIQRFRGTVDEFVGDGILAIFGAPVTEKDDSDRALACAVAMQLAIKEVNARNRADKLPEIAIGIGLNTGDVVAGNIGSELRSKYGVVGHNVNLAGRIESCTVGDQILAAQATISASSLEVLCGKGITVSLKGVGEPLELKEVLGVGLPYDLVLEPLSPKWLELGQQVPLTLAPVTGKQLLDTPWSGNLLAIADLQLRIQSEDTLPLLTDVRLEGLSAICYAKVTEASDDVYQLTLTSVSDDVRDTLRNLQDQRGGAT